MDTCKTCKWWKPCDTFWAVLRGRGDCEYRCYEDPFPDLAWPYDYGDRDIVSARLSTGPDFGCIHHEKRET